MSVLRRMPIRLRLTLAYVLVMAVVLAAAGTFLYLRLRSELDAGLDAGLRARAGDIATLLRSTENGLVTSRPAALTSRDETFAQVLTPTGRVFDATEEVRSASLLTGTQLERARRRTVIVGRSGTATPEERPARLVAMPVRAQNRSLVVVAGASLDARDEALGSLAAIMAVGGPVALLLTALAGYGVAAGALRPVEAMRRSAAAAPAAEAAHLPVPPANDEISRLGGTLNALLGRQAEALARERSFVGDASHELRTPLAILRAELELALQRPRPREALEDALRSAAIEADRLNQLAEDLLVIARFDQGRLPVKLEPLDCREVLADVRRRFERRAAEARRPLALEPGPCVPALADRLRLDQALGNMLENALRHGAGAIELSAESRHGTVELHVRDAGNGFPPGFAAVAFRRFSRADKARDGGGSGLGLAIVDAIAAAHGGSAGARNREGGGADVWIEIPDGRSAGSAGAASASRRVPQPSGPSPDE